jgi:hypothetical protein
MKAKSEHGITNAVHSMYGGDITTSGKNTQNKTNNHLYEEEEGVDVGEIVGHEDLELTNPTQENKVEGGKLITKTIIDEKGKEIKKKVKVLGTSSRLHLAYLLSLLLWYIWPQLVLTFYSTIAAQRISLSSCNVPLPVSDGERFNARLSRIGRYLPERGGMMIIRDDYGFGQQPLVNGRR